MLEKISITLMSGPRDGEIMVFPVEEATPQTPLVLTIGRREGSDIRLNYDSQVSRQHAHLGFDGTRFWLEDQGSRNGTFIDEERLNEGDRLVITPSTLFRVGRTWLRLDPLPNDITAAAEPFEPVADDEDTGPDPRDE